MGWFDTAELVDKARGFAAEYARLRASGAAMAVGEKRQERRYDKLAAEAVAYAGSLGLNLYKKSRFLQALRGGLTASAVPQAEADAFVERVIMGPLRPAAGEGR